MSDVDSILALSDVPNPAKYRNYLQALSEKKRAEILEDLKKDAAGPVRQPERGYQAAFGRKSLSTPSRFHHA